VGKDEGGGLSISRCACDGRFIGPAGLADCKIRGWREKKFGGKRHQGGTAVGSRKFMVSTSAGCRGVTDADHYSKGKAGGWIIFKRTKRGDERRRRISKYLIFCKKLNHHFVWTLLFLGSDGGPIKGKAKGKRKKTSGRTSGFFRSYRNI